jgi:hypothetical protein
MLKQAHIEKITENWGRNVVYAFKKGLWELEQKGSNKWSLRRFKGPVSAEVVSEVTITANNAEALAEALSSVRYSGKEKKIVGVKE